MHRELTENSKRRYELSSLLKTHGVGGVLSPSPSPGRLVESPLCHPCPYPYPYLGSFPLLDHLFLGLDQG